MRSIAILLVMYLHSLYLLPTGLGKYLSHIDFLLKIDGVGIFFVLSGFLIGFFLLNLEDSNQINLRQIFLFLIRRWLRTLPNYYLILFFVFFFSSEKINSSIIYFGHNFYLPYFNLFQESWSLSVEEFCYLIFPFCFLFFSYFLSFPYLFSCVILILINIIIKVIFDTDYLVIERTVIFRYDSIVIGLLFSFVFKRFKDIMFRKRYHLFLFAFLFYLLSYEYFFGTKFWFEISSLVYALAIPFFYFLEIKNQFFHAFFYKCSKYSYSLYLLNYTPFQLIILPKLKILLFPFLQESRYPFIYDYLAFWILVPIIAHLLYNYLEKPFMSLRNHLG
jgi:peptidoglycan/LPS O-acetylase OafA/YrhL